MNSHTLQVEQFRLFATCRGEPRSAVFSYAYGRRTPTVIDAYSRAYVITEFFIPELAKITVRDLGFHFDDLIHSKIVLGRRSR